MAISYARMWIVTGILFTTLSGCQYSTMPDEGVDMLESEISLLSDALIQYKLENGEFPPCMAKHDPNRLEKLTQHLKKAHPRHEYEKGLPKNLNLENLDSSEAIVFFLGGVPSDDESRRCLGYSTDPADPFASKSSAKSTFRSGYYEFDETRMTDHDQDGLWEYTPRGVEAPFVYFDSSSYEFCNESFELYGEAVAYRIGAKEWYAPDNFQVLSAGRDNDFGKGKVRVISSGKGMTSKDKDNYTSFGKISELQQ